MVARKRIEKILEVFNNLIFMSAIKFRFEWSDFGGTGREYGRCSVGSDGVALIQLNDALWREWLYAGRSQGRLLARLSTLLHEALHAILNTYVCHDSFSHRHCIGRGGHGQSWQIIAERFEVVAVRFLAWRPILGDGEACLVISTPEEHIRVAVI